MTERPVRAATGHEHGLSERLTYLVEQLWRPALEQGDVRAVLDTPESRRWRNAETYRVLPTATRATMLVPDATRAATVGSLLNYRGLRRRLPNAQRAVLGLAARGGLLPFPRLSLQVSTEAPVPVLPLATVAQALDLSQVHASIGINISANRKTTLQVISPDGAPLGFAKFSWEPASVTAVETEAAALIGSGGGTGPARAPRLLARGTYYGRPYIVTEPIPADSVAVRSGVSAPSAAELHSLLPLVRRARIVDTGQFQALRRRLTAVPVDTGNSETLGAAAALLDLVAPLDVEVPVVARWHGDLTAWNSARSGDGILWCWDWESSEEDAVAGLDALHWHLAAGAEAGHLWDGAALRAAVGESDALATAAGTPRRARAHVAAVYAATVAERACALAAGAGGWEAEWVLPAQLLDLMATARSLVGEHAGRSA